MKLKKKDLLMCWAVISSFFVLFYGSFLLPKNENLVVFYKKDYQKHKNFEDSIRTSNMFLEKCCINANRLIYDLQHKK